MNFSITRKLNRFTAALHDAYDCAHSLKHYSYNLIPQTSRAIATCTSILSSQNIYSRPKYPLHQNANTYNSGAKQASRNLKFFVPSLCSVQNIHSHLKTEVSELEEFEDVLNLLCKDLMSEQNQPISEALKWHLKVLQYNIKGGKKIRGLAVGKTYKILADDTLTQQKLHLAHILGWCVEMLQAFFLISDDIMDNSSMRRGKPCWYKNPDVGLCAINDSLLLQTGIYKIVKDYFGNLECYTNILEEFLEATRKTVYGQCLDMLSNPCNTTPRYETFNMERYNAIVEYKTSYYTFCLPVHLAMHLIGNFSADDFRETKQLCLKLGLLFQVQDDYLDCFGDSQLTGKVGNDINEGKCTWFVVRALQDSKGDIRNKILSNYGTGNAESSSKVLDAYNELSLEEKYLEFEKRMYDELKYDSQLLSNSRLKKLFDYLLHRTYKRKK